MNYYWKFKALGLSISSGFLLQLNAAEQEARLCPIALFQQKLVSINVDAKKIIGHNPKIEVIGKHDTSDVALFCHGWGGNKYEANVWQGIQKPIITFNFADAVPKMILKLHKSNFGQLPDVITMLYVLNQWKNVLKESGTFTKSRITLIGYSRGGATVVNALNVLHNRDKAHDKALKKIGITEQDRGELLQLIQQGELILHCPLTDIPATIKSWSARIRISAYDIVKQLWTYRVLKKCIINPCESLSNQMIKNIDNSTRNMDSFNMAYLNYVLLPLLTRYHIRGLQAIHSITKLPNLNLTILVIMHKDDRTVSNDAVKTFFKTIHNRDAKNSYFSVGKGTHVTPPDMEPVNLFLDKSAQKKLTIQQVNMLQIMQPKHGQNIDNFISYT